MTTLSAIEETTHASFPTAAVSGGEAVYWSLRALGVDCIFGISSIHNLPIFEAFDRLGGIEHVSSRHEQGATHAADGYARATGKLGVVVASTGPGTTNTATGLLEAAFSSSPVLVIAGQASSSSLGKGKGSLHEFERQLEFLRTLVPHAESVRSRPEIREVLLRIGRSILGGRPQPGAVQIPIDFLHAKAPERETPYEPMAPAAPAAASIDAAVELLNGAQRPVIWAGGGVAISGANDALRQISERLGAPVFTTVNGRGAIPWEHPNLIGTFADRPGAWDLLQDADAMLAVGTRFDQVSTGEWRTPIPGQLIHVDADPVSVGRSYRTAVPVVGDARLALEAILGRLDRGDNSEWVAGAGALRQRLEAELRQEAGPDWSALIDSFGRGVPDEALFHSDTTIPATLFFRRLLAVRRPRGGYYPTSSAIGPGLPTALGAAVGTDGPVLLLQGDGGIMLSLGELATLAETGARVVVCILNDRGYGAIRMLEQMAFGRSRFASELHTPDFVKLADSLGLSAERVSSPQELDAVLPRAFASGGPYLIDIDLTAMPSTDAVAYLERARAAGRR
ncbi:MAG: putative acetolactate synthase large subunit [Frankiales bacterium]|nr:putative acetolactate synthase large subunit [Frankiales bacterium]